MSPEQHSSPSTVDHRADIYALGVVFYQMLTGELPPHPLTPPSTKIQIDVRLDQIVLRALEKSPDLRYQSATDLKTQIETVIADPPPEPRRERRGLPSSNQTLVPPRSPQPQALPFHRLSTM